VSLILGHGVYHVRVGLSLPVGNHRDAITFWPNISAHFDAVLAVYNVLTRASKNCSCETVQSSPVHSIRAMWIGYSKYS